MSKQSDLQETDEWVNHENFTLSLERYDLDWVPVRPGTLSLYVNREKEGIQVLKDDGEGRLRDTCQAECGTVNYNTGIVQLPGTPNGVACLAQYRFNSDPPREKKRIEMKLTSTPVHAKVHKLKKGVKIVYNV